MRVTWKPSKIGSHPCDWPEVFLTALTDFALSLPVRPGSVKLSSCTDGAAPWNFLAVGYRGLVLRRRLHHARHAVRALAAGDFEDAVDDQLH